jgi:hypothetical protein
MSRLITHVRHNVIGYLALFVALGGTSYAAFSLPKNSVGTRQLRNGAVTNHKLANGSVGAKKLDGKSIAGSVAFWAQVNSDGTVIDSSPKAVVHKAPGGALYVVSWDKTIPKRCFALVSPTSGALDPTASATVQIAAGLPNSNALVTTSSKGSQAPEPFTVTVICP